MSIDMFLKVDEVPGESTDHEYKDTIEILNFNHHIAQASGITRSSAGSATNERVTHGDMSITKQMDKATTVINKKCNIGDHIPNIWLYLRRASGANPITYMTYHLTDSIVSSYSVSAPQGGDIPTENVTFNYGSITLTYKETDDKDAAKGAVETNWDLIENKEK